MKNLIAITFIISAIIAVLFLRTASNQADTLSRMGRKHDNQPIVGKNNTPLRTLQIYQIAETTKPKQSYEILKLRKNTRSMFMVAEGIVEMT